MSARAAAALVALSLCARAQEDGAAYVRELNAGVELFDKADYEEACLHFAKARQLRPQDWRGHAWHSMALVQQALGETGNPLRRDDLLRQGERVAGELIKKAGIGWSDPLTHYIRGVIASVRRDDSAAFELLRKAATAPRHRYAPYEDIDLLANAQRAYARASLQIATRLVVVGELEQADRNLAVASQYMPDEDPDRPMLERLAGVVAEYQGRLDDAVRHLRRVIELSPGRPEVREELTAAIAMIWIAAEMLDRGEQVLKELPADSAHPEVRVARVYLLYKQALRNPEPELVERAMEAHREVMKQLAEQDVYRVVEQYADLVLEKVRPPDLERGRALLEETIALLRQQMERRPECPGLYYRLSLIYKLLGNAEEELRYRKLHEVKKKEYETKEQYDHRGRPRCR